MACHFIPQRWRVIAARHLIAQIRGIMLCVPQHFETLCHGLAGGAVAHRKHREDSADYSTRSGNLFRLMNAEQQRYYRPAPRALSEMPA